jgi:hypothetical protein
MHNSKNRHDNKGGVGDEQAMHSSPFSSLSYYDLVSVCVMIPYAATVCDDELHLAVVSD